MAENNHGGYRRPSQPAPVSGPGALSRRTDGGPSQPVRIAPGGEYGSRQDMEQIQTGAPMAAGGSSATAPPAAAPAPLPERPPALDADTARPTEPITAGMGTVPGVRPNELDETTREKFRAHLPALLWLASQPRASEQTRDFVRRIRADI